MTYKIIYRLKATNCDTPWQDCIRMNFTEKQVKVLLASFREALPENEFYAREAFVEPKLMPW